MYGKSLAHIEKIKSVHPIEGADNIERVTVLDWNLVAKKGEFQPGDLALYVEIGAILPDGLEDADRIRVKELEKIISEHRKYANACAKAQEKGKEPPAPDTELMPQEDAEKEMAELQAKSKYPYFEFLRPKKFRIKTMNLTKFDVISQGILFRLDVVGIDPSEAKVGADFTERFGITEEIEDAEEAGLTAKPLWGPFKWFDKKLMRYRWYRDWKKSRAEKAEWFNWFPAKSDEENAQKIYSGLYEQYGDRRWVATEKLEGQSIAICSREVKGLFGKKKKIYVASRTRNLPWKGCSTMKFWQTVKKLGLDEKIKNIPGEWFCRGEHVGEGIQKNIYGLHGNLIRFYDIIPFDKEKGKFCGKLAYEDTVKFCEDYELPYVPVIDDDFRLPADVQDMLKISIGTTVFGNNPKHEREGLVLRLYDDYNVSFKAKSPTYKL